MIVKGQKINERYQIIKTIGEGGMANVYLAYDTILDRNVAVKVLRGDLATDEKFVRRFQREALSASSLSHPNIVEVYDVGEDNESYYIVMEYIEGKQLKQLLKKRGKLTLNEVVDIMLQVTDGMSAAHDSYIIHRDIKPQNIMILENGLIKITDFGIAMALNSTQLTQTNSVMGSVHYLPPEQASGKGATIQSDVYSMGILMYELLTGELPFRGDNAVEIALKQIKEPIPSVKDKIDVPQSIENIIIKATAKNPKNRYADAREMYEDLRTALSKERENEPKYVLKYAENDNDNIKKSEVRTTPVPPDMDEKNNKKKAKDKNEEFLDKFAETTEIKATKIEEKKKKSSDKDERKKENKLLLILAIIFTGLIVLTTAGYLMWLFLFSNTKEVKITDVKNMTVVDAETALEKLGLEVENEVKYEDSSDVEEGNVTRTSPQIGRTVKKGTKITLYVSSGEGGIVLEDYTGQNFNKIQGILEEKNIFVVVKKEEPEDYNNVTADQILRQEPEKGKLVKSGQTVTLYIPDMNTTYPDFTEGYDLKKIQEWCDKYSVDFAEPDYVPTDEYPEGKIYKQSPLAGTRVQTGQKLKIYIAEALDDEGNYEGTGTGEE